jgi:hypothetical protein
MTDCSKIDAELDTVRLSSDGSRLILLLRDAEGQKLSVSLPTGCVNALVTAAPYPTRARTVYSVATWNMSPAGNGEDLVLTLCTPEGMVASFTVTSWQAHGMATVVTYGQARESVSRSVH